MTEREEQQLVKDAQKSLHAFTMLYEHYLPKIYKYVLNRVGNKNFAEDITSQTFLKTLRKLNTFNNNKSFRSWLYTIAHNNIIDFYRKNRTYVISIDSIETFLESENKTESLAEKTDLANEVLDILKKLPESYQQVLALRFFEEKTNSEIAEILNCKINNVNVKIHRAIKSFEKHLRKNNSDLIKLLDE